VTGFSGSPRVLKGAIIGIDPFNPLASIVVFQYNPETLERTIRPRTAAEGSDQGDALRLSGPPEETISLDIELDATDALETAEPLAVANGVAPSLAALEMLVYPKAALVIANEVLAGLGVIEVIPPQAPLTVFVWGPKRVVPVRLSSLTVTEEAFDQALNPIRATAKLSLTVLTYDDLGVLSVGGALSLANHVVKEALATISGVGTLVSTGASLGG
jgi:Contractile injection system tube protein